MLLIMCPDLRNITNCIYGNNKLSQNVKCAVFDFYDKSCQIFVILLIYDRLSNLSYAIFTSLSKKFFFILE